VVGVVEVVCGAGEVWNRAPPSDVAVSIPGEGRYVRG
jgi:hypothetical protein